MHVREWAINGGRLFTMLVLIALIILGVYWLVAFALAAVESLGTIFLVREDGGPGRI